MRARRALGRTSDRHDTDRGIAVLRPAPFLLALFLLGAVPGFPAFAFATTVEIHVQGLGSAQGNVQVQLCERAEWLKDCVREITVKAVAGTTVVVVPNVPPGVYAALGFHDINANGKVDQNFLGIPKEGVGFSRVTTVPLGEPSFDSAALRVEGTRVVIPIRLFFEP